MRFPVLLLLPVLAADAAAADCWDVDYADSRLEFSGVQAGAPFEGVFHDWRAEICFDPQNPDDGRFHVTIRLASVDTRAADRDEALRGPEFFHVDRWPESTYETSGFSGLEDGFKATGRLTLRDVTRSVPVEFRFTSGADGTAALEGDARLRRLDFDVGLGEWRDTRWVANEVSVSFSLSLAPR